MRNYGISEESARRERLLSLFYQRFGRKSSLLLSSPGGAELIGGLTEDHFGKGICTAISRDLLFCADKRPDDRVEIGAEGTPLLSFSVYDLENRERERGKLVSLARGVLRYFRDRGFSFGGFSVFFHSELPQGASFPAAFSVILSKLLDILYFGGKLSAVDCAAAGTYAERFAFSQSDAFSEHVAIASGGCVYIDFASGREALPLPFPKGYGFVLTDLSDLFEPVQGLISVKKEMSAAAAYFNRRLLSEVPFAEFEEQLPRFRRTVGDRAALCALHFYEDSRRADRAAAALKDGDPARFFRCVNECGERERELLGDCRGEDAAALSMRLGGLLLKRGATRLNGSTVLAIADEEERTPYLREMIRLFGRDRVKIAEYKE